VVGPLTRNGVSALAAEAFIPVPTLTLNIVEEKPAPLLYFFGMAAEAEARQLAQLARRQGLNEASSLRRARPLPSACKPPLRRMERPGRRILREIEYNNGYEELPTLPRYRAA